MRILSTDLRRAEPGAIIVDRIGRQRRFQRGDFISERGDMVWQIDNRCVVTKSATYLSEYPLLALHRLAQLFVVLRASELHQQP